MSALNDPHRAVEAKDIRPMAEETGAVADSRITVLGVGGAGGNAGAGLARHTVCISYARISTGRRSPQSRHDTGYHRAVA